MMMRRFQGHLVKALTAVAPTPPPSSSLQNRLQQGRLVPLASFRSFCNYDNEICCCAFREKSGLSHKL